MKKSSFQKRLPVLAVLGFVLCLGMVGCQPQQAANDAKPDKRAKTSEQSTEAPSLPSEWTVDADCAVCHAEEAASSSNAACLAGHHTSEQSFACITCHADEAGLKAAHGDMTGKIPKKLKKTEVDEALCNSCHTAEEYDAVAASGIVLTDSEGTEVNPHALPENENHAATTCVDCHTGHSEEGHLQSAQDYCISCHHENVYACGTCHG